MSRPIPPSATDIFLRQKDKDFVRKICEEAGIKPNVGIQSRLESRDWREMVAQRKAEKQAAEALGLTLPYCRPKKEDA